MIKEAIEVKCVFSCEVIFEGDFHKVEKSRREACLSNKWKTA